MNSFDEQYEIRHFLPGLTTDASGAEVPDAATEGWAAAVSAAFHETRAVAATDRATAVRAAMTDGRSLTGVYALEPRTAMLPHQPVGTFVSYPGTLNVGGGALLDAHLISDVTVRPTHRRRGILRRVMVDDLRRAADAGNAVAALTVSEATIYRRFGFGPATHLARTRVDTRDGLALLTQPAGAVELADPAALDEIARDVFARFHGRTPGSVSRHEAEHAFSLTGTAPGQAAEPRLQAAVHLGADGQVDGFVTYKPVEQGETVAVQVVDLVAGSDDAYLGLWQTLGTIDLTTEVVHRSAPLDDPLHHALVDSRRRRVTDLTDHLWLRVLDPVAALGARGYVVDGVVTLRVHDALGFADGTFRVEVRDGRASVTRDDAAAPDVELDVSALGSVYLGGTDPVSLAAAGLVVERVPGALVRLRTLLGPDRSVYCLTHF